MRATPRIAIVTGAGSGIGAAAAKRLAADGATVIVTDIDVAQADAVASEIASSGGEASPLRLDVTNEQMVEVEFAALLGRYGRIDVLVNSAGVPQNTPVLDIAVDVWRRILDINLTGSFLCSQQAGRAMIAAGSGRIVNVSSVNGQKAVPGRGAYSASKAGLEMLTKLMAAEIGRHGVTVNAVAPGPVETPLVKAMHTPAIREGWAQVLPIPRYAEPAEVAAAISFLSSDEAAYVNGQVLNIDGGFAGAALMRR